MQIWSMHASQAVVRRHGDLGVVRHCHTVITGSSALRGSTLQEVVGCIVLEVLHVSSVWCLVGNGGMDPHSRPCRIPNSSLHNPFPHSLLRTGQKGVGRCSSQIIQGMSGSDLALVLNSHEPFKRVLVLDPTLRSHLSILIATPEAPMTPTPSTKMAYGTCSCS